MTTLLTTQLKQYLSQDATITSYTSDRIHEREIRRAGPDAAGIVGPTGGTLTHIILDDAGGTSAPLGPQGAYLDRLQVTVVVANTTDGRTALRELTARLLVKLHRYQIASTKAFLTYADRTGLVPDPTPDTGALERLTFSVSGTLIGVAT